MRGRERGRGVEDTERAEFVAETKQHLGLQIKDTHLNAIEALDLNPLVTSYITSTLEKNSATIKNVLQ